MVVEMLNSEGYQIVEADSGDDALALLGSNSIDAFLLDIDLPGRNGIEICQELRAIGRYKLTPIILFTGRGAHDQTVAAFESGCDDVVISDPMNGVVLLRRLRGHIQRTEYLQQLERTRATMSSYLSRRTQQIVAERSETGDLRSPEERNLAILFTDLRGFTAMSEDMEPVALFELVSKMLGHQVNLIHEFGGYVDKFGGDGVMAIFEPDKVVESCLCALRIMESSHLVIPEASKGLWQSGIGIHTGPVVIGNIGTLDHLDYSAIGRTVNLAARLCGHAQGTSVVVSKAVRDAAAGDPRIHFHSERKVDIRGIREQVTVYTLGEDAD